MIKVSRAKKHDLNKIPSFFCSWFIRCLLSIASILVFLFPSSGLAYSQNYNPYQSGYSRQQAFRQEIARLNITVERSGEIPLPIQIVPRLRKDDIVRVRMIEQPVNGVLPSESLWDWTLVVAFVNPGRKEDDKESVSREINFRRDGWYQEHSFMVPYDSQPIFFLYPRQNYREKIRKFINNNIDDVRKIGEKTLEIADAYAQIGTFLNRLQGVIQQNPDVYGNNAGYNPYSYNSGYYGYESPQQKNFLREQFVERLAESFNIALPECWKKNSTGYNYGSANNSNDFVSRAQCVAQNVKLEDFDLSISKMLTEGGLLASTQMVKKYPELAHWIQIAAVAADLILKITRKTPLKIYPTITNSAGNPRQSYESQNYNPNNYQNNQTGYNQSSPQPRQTYIESQPVSVFADNAPTNSNHVSAFPIVLNEWQPERDPELIKLPVPAMLEPCLHVGRNFLKNTDVSYDWLRDRFARDFRLVISSKNGFTKELNLNKNIGMYGWEFILNAQDLTALAAVKTKVEAQIVAMRGFNKIRSEKFDIPLPGEGRWIITDTAKSEFSVGGIRKVVIANEAGNCLCLRSIKYKPAFGGEFEFGVRADANPIEISEDGISASFDIDTSAFKPGEGNLEVFEFGALTPHVLPISLYGPPPLIKRLRVHKGDKHLSIEGDRIEQIKSLKVNGKLAHLTKDPAIANEGQAVFEFQESNDMVISNKVDVELWLVGYRRYKYPESFSVQPSRPTITNHDGEIEAAILDDGSTKKYLGPFDLSPYSAVPIGIKSMSVVAQTTLTDYVFRAGNISIETRIENDPLGQIKKPEAIFEVIDSVNIRVGFVFDEENRRFLAGSRLQFRIKDRERGHSDWYTIKQTFVRIPQIDSVNCHNGQCGLVGKGLDYIGSYSTDGGLTWKPPIVATATSDGRFLLVFPDVKDRKSLQVKLRDFENTLGFSL